MILLKIKEFLWLAWIMQNWNTSCDASYIVTEFSCYDMGGTCWIWKGEVSDLQALRIKQNLDFFPGGVSSGAGKQSFTNFSWLFNALFYWVIEGRSFLAAKENSRYPFFFPSLLSNFSKSKHYVPEDLQAPLEMKDEKALSFF